MMSFSGESSEIAFSETEMEAAEQLVQMSEEDTMSCSSGGLSVCGCGYVCGGGCCEGGGKRRKRQEDVVTSKIVVGKEEEKNDGVLKNKNDYLKVELMEKNKKKQKIRSLASIYRATKEMK